REKRIAQRRLELLEVPARRVDVDRLEGEEAGEEAPLRVAGVDRRERALRPAEVAQHERAQVLGLAAGRQAPELAERVAGPPEAGEAERDLPVAAVRVRRGGVVEEEALVLDAGALPLVVAEELVGEGELLVVAVERSVLQHVEV